MQSSGSTRPPLAPERGPRACAATGRDSALTLVLLCCAPLTPARVSCPSYKDNILLSLRPGTVLAVPYANRQRTILQEQRATVRGNGLCRHHLATDLRAPAAQQSQKTDGPVRDVSGYLSQRRVAVVSEERF